MNKINKIVTLLVVMAGCFSSCELKNELEGKYKLKENEGLLNLTLVPKTVQTKASAADGMDVNTFQVEIVDAATDAVVRTYATYEKLREALPIILPVGAYKIAAKSGELLEASRTPYFAGNTNIDVKQGIESIAEVVCKLGTVKVDLKFSDDFFDTFSDDYSIGVTNGSSGVIYFTQSEISSVYLNAPPGAVSFKVAAKVTDKVTGRDVETNYTIEKPEGELMGGDAFNIEIKPTDEGGTGPEVPGVPNKPTVGVKLEIDLTMEETGITIKVPTECIEESKPEEPGEPGEGSPEIIGADDVVELNVDNSEPTVQITIKAPAGIANLFVTITSNSDDFMDTITPGGLNETFDLANLSDELAGALADLGLIDPSKPIKGETEFLFDISGFMPLLGVFGTAEHYFTIKVMDSKGRFMEKKLTVNVVVPQL